MKIRCAAKGKYQDASGAYTLRGLYVAAMAFKRVIMIDIVPFGPKKIRLYYLHPNM